MTKCFACNIYRFQVEGRRGLKQAVVEYLEGKVDAIGFAPVERFQAYKGLIEHVENWLFGVPNPEALTAILESRLPPRRPHFSPGFPTCHTPLDQLSHKLGISPDKLSEKMEPMIKKGMIFQDGFGCAERRARNQELPALREAWRVHREAWHGREDPEGRDS